MLRVVVRFESVGAKRFESVVEGVRGGANSVERGCEFHRNSCAKSGSSAATRVVVFEGFVRKRGVVLEALSEFRRRTSRAA